SQMINRYRRAARTAAELGLGELLPLDVAIPELAADGGKGPKGGVKGDAADQEAAAQTTVEEVSPGCVPQEAPDLVTPRSGAWIRTTIRGFKVPRPALRRRRTTESPHHSAPLPPAHPPRVSTARSSAAGAAPDHHAAAAPLPHYARPR